MNNKYRQHCGAHYKLPWPYQFKRETTHWAIDFDAIWSQC